MRFDVVFVLCACVAATLAASYTYKGNFVETREDAPYAETSGSFYYLYDTEGFDKCRLYLEYNLPNGTNVITVKNLYHFQYDRYEGRSVLYSMCDQCTAETIKDMPDPWYFDNTVYAISKRTSEVSGHSWYDKKQSNSTGQVKSIRMNGNSDPAKTDVSAIEFTDGRTFTISNFAVDSSVTSSNSMFKPLSSCPVPTCGMFTDIVFVLDFSGSVSVSEWNETANFVIGVLNSFTFGDQAAAAACVKFTTSAGVIAAADTPNGWTVSTNKRDLINSMSESRRPSGGTCQGSGLELAMQIFDRSTRRSKNPHKIVISVTDGADACRARSQTAAKNLRDEYDAFVISVGVGISSKNRQWLVDYICSSIGGQPAYYPVSNYGQIKGLVDTLFSPMCDQYSYDYGSSCKGFRGCGKCFCPKCTKKGTKCSPITCTARDGTSKGCVETPKNCGTSTKCFSYTCNDDDGQCVETDLCFNVKKNYINRQCATVSCNLADGSCPVKFDDDFCKQKHRKNCEVWQCDHEPNGANTNYHDEYGCIMVENVTAECEKQKSPCLNVNCDIEKLACVKEDKCKEYNNKCHTFTCDVSKGKCVDKETDRPANLKDDKCTKYNCFNDSGWMKNETASWDANKCRLAASDRTCKIFSCEKTIGCVNKTDSACHEACEKKEEECWNDASSTLAKCQLAKCVGETEKTVHCEYNTSNCKTSEAANKAKEMNAKNDGGCYSYKCSYGTCEFYEVLPRHVSTACVTWTCVGSVNEGWHWKDAQTKEATNCKSDICFERTCDDAQGCIPVKDICEAKSDMCTQFTCNNNKTCDKKNLLVKYECMEEKCAADGTKFADWHDEVCSNKHDCTYCSHDRSVPETYGRCVSYPLPNDADNCTIYTCNTTSVDCTHGECWIESPKCDDGFFCTEDKCSVDGECWTVNIDCYQEINMTDYACFRAACKEDSSAEKGYRCVRKLKAGAYMDICGRCITITDESSESSSSTNEEVACVDAPVEPLIKEGIAAATIGMIVLLVVLVGGVLGATSVIGTKVLLERARAANNQSAHSNPLFEENAAEMSNPTYAGEN